LFELAKSIWPAPKELKTRKLQEKVSIETDEQPVKKGENKSSKAEIKYDVTVYDITVKDQGYRNAMLHVMKTLCEHGAKPAEIAELIHWRPGRIFFDVEGTCSSDEFVKRASMKVGPNKKKRFDPTAWFCDDEELINYEGKTYAFSKRWGVRWKQALKILGNHFTDANFEITKSDEV
jgi:hypothetical protein